MTTRSPKTYKKPQPLPNLPSSPSSPTNAQAELARISSSSPSRRRQWADAAAPPSDAQGSHPQPPQRLPLSKRRPAGQSLKFMHDVGGTGSASSSAAGHSPTSPTSPTALSRRIDGPSTRPGTASTVSSFVSARPFMDEASPVRGNLRLPPIDPLQSPVYLQRSTDEMTSTTSDSTTVDRLPSATSSVYTLPIGASANHANLAVAEPRSPTSGKRLILASATAATHGSVAESGGEEDVRSITSSSRRTLQAHDDSAASSSSCDHSSAADVHATPRPRSHSRVSSKGTRKHAAVDGRPPDERVSAPSRAPPEAPKSLPVHPHHRKQRDGPTDDEGAESSSASLSASPNPQDGYNDGANTIRAPTSRARTLSHNVPSSGNSNHYPETEKEDVRQVKRAPLQDSNVHVQAKREDGQAARSTSNLASDYVATDKSPANSNSAAGGTGLREKFKKTGGFFRRLGGGGGNAGAANSAGRTLDEHSNEGHGIARQENADGSLGLEKSSSPLLSPPSRRNILRNKASHSSLVSESGTVNARRMSGASRSDENASRSRETSVPVPAVPAQYRDQRRTSEGQNAGHGPSKQDGTSRKDSQMTMSPSTKSSVITDQDQSISYSTSNTTVRGGPKGHKKGGNAASTSTDFDRAMRSWEKEMDAALEKTGKDLAEKTKIEPPKPNWTPSPQLPEYRVLNRKGSFMDEGADDNRARQLSGQDDDDDNDDDLKYTTVKSHFAPADSSYEVDKSTLASTFGISVGRHAKTSTDKGSESISYDSHFLRPEASRMPRRSEPGHLLAGAANGKDSLKSISSSRNVPGKAKRSVSEFKHLGSEDTENTRPLREDNASIATFRSFETAVDRFSTITRHGGATNAAAIVDESTSEKEQLAAKQSPQVTPLPTLPSKDPSRSPMSSPIDNELSIRLVPRPSVDSTAENATSPIDDGISAPKQAVEKDDEEEMAKQLAQKCWVGDETFKKREKIAEWLGGFGSINKHARQLYFTNFDFQDLSVDAALRKLCDKLYLRAETQQVDRILSAFSQRYFECNRKTQFGSADVVHAITFSILLLNTDLHVAELSDRMTRAQFVRNTLDAVLEQDKSLSSAKQQHDQGVHLEGERTGDEFQKWETQMEATLRDIYQSVKSDRIRLPMSGADALTQRGPATPMRMGSERMTALKRGSIRGIQSLMGGGATGVSSNAVSGQGSLSGSNAANGSPLMGSPSTFLASNSAGSTSMGPPVSWNVTPSVGFANTLSKSIIRETHDETNEDNESIGSDKEDVTDEELALLGPPWAKEGMLTRKHYWEAPSKRAKDKNWIDCFTVIQKGQLSMFRFGATTTSSGTVKQAQAPGIGGGNWLSNATLIGQFSLAHSLANILPPPGYNRSRPHVFALTLSSGSVYFFQSAHEELAQEWTSTCNYWAARLSKEPLAAGISNMEYGWNRVQAFSNDEESADGSTAHLGEADAPSTGVAGAGGRRKSVAGSTTESEFIESSPTSQYPYASSSPYGNAKGGDARSIRSGRSGRSGRSSRMRATLSTTLFQNWSNGNTLERISSNQSGKSSPVTSVISLSTPGTSIAASDRPFIVHEWRAPAPPTTSSTLSEEEQLEACIRHTQRIEQELTHHNSLHQPMMQLFKQMSSKGRLLATGKSDAASSLSLSPPSKSAGASAISLPSQSASSHKKGYGNGGVGGGNAGGSGNVANMAAKALANWERKSAHLLAELTKFQVYIDSLKSASRTRSETNAQRQLNRMMRQADED